MKKLFVFIFCITPSFATQICGPVVTNIGYSYTVENPSGTIAGYWAIGLGCAGEVSGDVTASCDSVVVTGRANCETQNTSGAITGGLGGECHCRRLKILSNNQLVDSVANSYTKVVVYTDKGLPDVTTCLANCTRLCAEEVALNTYGYRNMIMMLSAQ